MDLRWQSSLVHSLVRSGHFERGWPGFPQSGHGRFGFNGHWRRVWPDCSQYGHSFVGQLAGV